MILPLKSVIGIGRCQYPLGNTIWALSSHRGSVQLCTTVCAYDDDDGDGDDAFKFLQRTNRAEISLRNMTRSKVIFKG